MNLTPPLSELTQNPAIPVNEFIIDAYLKQHSSDICLHASP